MQELVRRINFFTTSLIGIIGLSVSLEVIHEKDLADKLDDFLLFVVALVGIWWYKRRGYQATKATGSVILVVASFIIKVIGIIIERADAEALGDDIGIGITLLLACVFVGWQVINLKKIPVQQ